MNNFNKIQPVEGYHFVNYLIDNKKDSAKTKNGKFTISLVNKPKSYETVTWAPRCLIPIREVFRIAHPALRNKYFKIKFNFFPPTHIKKPMFYVMVEKLLGIKI